MAKLPVPGTAKIGTNGNDKMNGTAKSEMFYGMAGNDTITAGGGNDVIDGNIGNDVINAGAGIDTITILGSDKITGGTGSDIFVASGTPYNLQLASNSSTILDFKAKGAGRDILELANFGVSWKDRDADMNDGFSMVKKGKDVQVTINDDAGNSYKILLKKVGLASLTQKNVVLVGLDDFPDLPDLPDLPFGLAGMNAPAAEAAPVVLDPVFGTDDAERMTGTANHDFLVGLAGSDTLRGLAGDDTLTGQSDADVLSGGKGEDRIYISGGDRAFGGAGADTFIYLGKASYPDIADPGRAVIADFDASQDKIEILGYDISFDDGDKGVDDGFEIRAMGDDTRLRLMDAEGAIATIILKDVAAGDLGADHFSFFI